jgi:Sec-independent protein secretion pathway component TatC
VLTPSGDPLSMMMMAVPLQILYELSILIAWVWSREKKDANELSV